MTVLSHLGFSVPYRKPPPYCERVFQNLLIHWAFMSVYCIMTLF